MLSFYNNSVIFLKIYLKKSTPLVASLRHKKFTAKGGLLKKPLVKKLIIRKISQSGRTKNGNITVRHKGGGNKKLFKQTSIKFGRFSQFGICVGLTYDPTRTAYVALIKYAAGFYIYMLASQGLFLGRFIKFVWWDYKKYTMHWRFKPRSGSATYLKYLKINQVCCLIVVPGNEKVSHAKSAGTKCVVKYKKKDKFLYGVRIPSGEKIEFDDLSVVLLGRVSNWSHKREIVGNAGSNRIKGIRPTTRGVAMNPVDHPHGGRTRSHSPERTPWGRVAKKSC